MPAVMKIAILAVCGVLIVGTILWPLLRSMKSRRVAKSQPGDRVVEARARIAVAKTPRPPIATTPPVSYQPMEQPVVVTAPVTSMSPSPAASSAPQGDFWASSASAVTSSATSTLVAEPVVAPAPTVVDVVTPVAVVAPAVVPVVTHALAEDEPKVAEVAQSTTAAAPITLHEEVPAERPAPSLATSTVVAPPVVVEEPVKERVDVDLKTAELRNFTAQWPTVIGGRIAVSEPVVAVPAPATNPVIEEPEALAMTEVEDVKVPDVVPTAVPVTDASGDAAGWLITQSVANDLLATEDEASLEDYLENRGDVIRLHLRLDEAEFERLTSGAGDLQEWIDRATAN